MLDILYRLVEIAAMFALCLGMGTLIIGLMLLAIREN